MATIPEHLLHDPTILALQIVDVLPTSGVQFFGRHEVIHWLRSLWTEQLDEADRRLLATLVGKRKLPVHNEAE